jgi:hypothetical protein
MLKPNAEDTNLPESPFDSGDHHALLHEAPMASRELMSTPPLNAGGRTAVIDISTDYEPSPRCFRFHVLEYQSKFHTESADEPQLLFLTVSGARKTQ